MNGGLYRSKNARYRGPDGGNKSSQRHRNHRRYQSILDTRRALFRIEKNLDFDETHANKIKEHNDFSFAPTALVSRHHKNDFGVPLEHCQQTPYQQL
jgi:hypothetical protein